MKQINTIEELTDNNTFCHAFAVVKDFFNDRSMWKMIKDTNLILKAATTNKRYKAGPAEDVVLIKEWYQKLIGAAYILSTCYSHHPKVMVKPANDTGLPDISRQDDFLRSGVDSLWRNFPRHLSLKEYLDPYMAIDKFVTAKTELEWKDIMELLAEYALSGTSIIDVDASFNFYKVQLRLLKLVEALHLVFVRTLIK